MVENADISQNFDRRVLTERWNHVGHHAFSKRYKSNTPTTWGTGFYLVLERRMAPTPTQSTSRFVQDQKEFDISSISVLLWFQTGMDCKIGFERLRLTALMNEVTKISSIKIERVQPIRSLEPWRSNYPLLFKGNMKKQNRSYEIDEKTIWILALLIPAFTGCSDWLDVSSKTEIPAMTSAAKRGFKDAVIGVYVKMSKPGSMARLWPGMWMSSFRRTMPGFRCTDLNVLIYCTIELLLSLTATAFGRIVTETIANINNVWITKRNQLGHRPVVDSLVRARCWD